MAGNFAYTPPRVLLTDIPSRFLPTSTALEAGALSPGARSKVLETDSPAAGTLGTLKFPEWFEPVREKLAGVLDLPSNWDSYGAKPVNPEIVAYALELLFDVMNDAIPAPSVVPTSRGGVQLEWHTTQGDLEIEIEAPYKAGAFFEDTPRGESWEENRVIDLGKLQSALVRLVQTELP